METLKVDRTKLKTITNYSNEYGISRQTVYNWIKAGKLKLVDIDGVQFIQLS